MGKTAKKLLKAVAAAAVFIALIFTVMGIAYRHRSDPKNLQHYETSNPHISSGMPMISAHRAGAGIAPEETMMSFKTCAENQDFDVEYFEFDLHITKDDVLVLLHDAELDRTSDCEEVFGTAHCRPEDYTFAQLRTLNMGAKFTDANGDMPFSQYKGSEVPDDLKILSLDMILDYLESVNQYRYIIEIKNGGDLGKRSADILYDALKERNMLDRVIFGCFKSEVSDYKDEAYPDLIRGAYTKEVAEFYFSSLIGRKNYVPKFGVLQLPFNEPGEDYHFNLATATVVNYAHAHDLSVQYWTVDDEAEAKYLINIGADLIITDYPDKVYHIEEELK